VKTLICWEIAGSPATKAKTSGDFFPVRAKKFAPEKSGG